MKLLNQLNIVSNSSRLLAYGLLSSALMCASFSASANKDRLSTIDVQAEGVVASIADLASFTIGVETKSEKASDAVEQNALTMQQINDALDDLDIPKKDRQTLNYSLNQEYDYQQRNNEAPKLIGFSVNHQVSIVNLAINNLGAVIDKLTSEGSTQISSIRFSSSNEIEQIAKARKLAVKNAMQKAKDIAEAADVELDDIINISEQSYSSPSHKFNSRMLAAEASFDGAQTSISQGEISHRVSVSLRYSFED